MKNLSRYPSRSEKKYFFCSKAGVLGASIRWQGHVKRPTTHIRIYQDDYNKLVSLVGKLPSVDSISSAVHYALDCVSSRRNMACKKS